MQAHKSPQATAAGHRPPPATAHSPPPPATGAALRLSDEQRVVAHAPIDEALAVVAAAGTGKTHTMTGRARFLLGQGVAAEEVLVLTLSRKAAGEFRERLLRHVPGAKAATVCTFHSWSWMVVWRHWREAGFERRPTILAAEQQELALMRDCIMWDQLAAAQAEMRGWLFLPPSVPWPQVVAAVAERHAPLFHKCMQAALAAHSSEQQPGSRPAPSAGEAAARSFAELPTRLQLLLVGELHASLQQRFDGHCRGEPDGGVLELLAAADAQALFFLRWLEGEKRRGHMPDGAAYAALCARVGEGQERQRQLARVAVAYQAELRRQCLVPLSDLPLLARQLLAARGGALAWAQERWTHLLVDEFQDSAACMLDLLKLLMGPRRSIVVVGCPDQTIYSFLDAAPQIFADYQRHFGARKLCLQTNFRSTAAICAFGCTLLHGNRRDAEGGMVPARAGACRPVHVRQFHTAEEEAAALADEVLRLWREEGVAYSSVCVLYRCLRLQGAELHAPLTASLRRLGIPHVIAGHGRLAEDPAVAALLAYLAASLEVDPAFEVVLGLPHHGLGREVCGALAQQQAAARLAGQLPPSLLACAEQVCTQAEAMLTQAPWQGQQAAVQVGPQSASQLEHVVSQLYTGDLQELSRLVLLLRGMRRAVGQEPLPRALRRVLQDSGLAAWLQQHGPAGAAAAVGSQQQRLGGGGDLPASLRCVLDKAEQLAAEWQQQQAEGRGRRPAGSGVGGAADGGSWCPAHAAGAASQQEAGEELVRELLARLATDTAADECAVQRRSGAASQRQQQAPGCDPGALTIGTIHSAKGLEWPVVLLPSVCQGLLPLRFRPPAWQAGDGAAALRACPRAHLEEERRLFHVAATRARDTLLVSFVQPPPPGAPAEPGDEELEASAAPAPQPELEPAGELRCSSILAGTVHRLRHQPDVLRFEGRLPHQDCCQAEWEEEEAQAGGMLHEVGNRPGSHGGPCQPQAVKLSLAERARRQLADNPRAGKLRARGGVAKQAQRQCPAAVLQG